MPRARAAALLFFFLGIFTCTWDLVLNIDIGGFTLKAHQGFFFFAFLLTLAPKLLNPLAEARKLPLKGFALSLLGLALYYLASSLRSEFPLKSFLYSGWLLFSLSAIWLTLILLRDTISKKLAAMAVLCGAFFQAALIAVDQIAYQFGYQGGLIGFNQDIILHWGVSRPHGFAMEPSYVAVFLTFALLMGFGLISSMEKKSRAWLAAALGLVAFALVACTSRTGWFSTILGSVLFLALSGTRTGKMPWKKLGGLAVAAALAFGLYAASIPAQQRTKLSKNLIGSMFQGNDGSGNARLRAHIHAWQMAKETNWAGTGLGASYKYWTTRHETVEPDKPKEFGENSYGREVIMSIWGQLLAEGGVPAVLLYLAGAFFMVRALWLRWDSSGDPLAQAALASALVFFCFTAFWLGNVARGDVWVWFAIWGRMALPDPSEETAQGA